jgi:glutamate racemase
MPDVNLIDSGEHSAVAAIRLLGEKNLLNPNSDALIKNPSVKFYVTDIPSTFNDIAKMFLNFNISEPEIVSFGN